MSPPVLGRTIRRKVWLRASSSGNAKVSVGCAMVKPVGYGPWGAVLQAATQCSSRASAAAGADGAWPETASNTARQIGKTRHVRMMWFLPGVVAHLPAAPGQAAREPT